MAVLGNLMLNSDFYECLPRLEPYRVLVQDLAKLVFHYYQLAMLSGVRATSVFTPEEEEEAILKYIGAFERFLSKPN